MMTGFDAFPAMIISEQPSTFDFHDCGRILSFPSLGYVVTIEKNNRFSVTIFSQIHHKILRTFLLQPFPLFVAAFYHLVLQIGA
jgi:hypothetical protein